MLEDPYLRRDSDHTPRASLILGAGEASNAHTEIWMGGAHSNVGEALSAEAMGSSWVIDCAGEIERAYRDAAGRWLACVFPDLDGPLSTSNRVVHVVRDAVEGIALGNGHAPDRVYVMCQHGMNRSGLVTGLILRGLGLGPRETVERIRSVRPGALANDAFRLMVLAE